MGHFGPPPNHRFWVLHSVCSRLFWKPRFGPPWKKPLFLGRPTEFIRVPMIFMSQNHQKSRFFKNGQKHVFLATSSLLDPFWIVPNQGLLRYLWLRTGLLDMTWPKSGIWRVQNQVLTGCSKMTISDEIPNWITLSRTLGSWPGPGYEFSEGQKMSHLQCFSVGSVICHLRVPKCSVFDRFWGTPKYHFLVRSCPVALSVAIGIWANPDLGWSKKGPKVTTLQKMSKMTFLRRHFLDPWEVSKKWSFWHFFDIFEKEWFLGSFWTPLWNHPISDNYSKKGYLRVKRGHFRPPKVTKKGSKKWPPLGDPLTRGTPQITQTHFGFLDEKKCHFWHFPRQPKKCSFWPFSWFSWFSWFFVVQNPILARKRDKCPK